MNERTKLIKKIIVVALSIFMALLVAALIINIVKLSAQKHVRDDLAAYDRRLDELIAENDKFIENSSHSDFIEDYARQYLDMVYRNETVVIVKKKQTAGAGSARFPLLYAAHAATEAVCAPR